MSDILQPRLRLEAHRQALQIAVDGTASAGKSTVGSRLAHLLGCPCLDTGLMYRAVTALAMEAGVSESDATALVALVEPLRFELSAQGQLSLDGESVGDNVRTPEVDATVSAVSVHGAVRAALVAQQQAMATGCCFVMVGRDIGTVVLPDAPVKLWITASAAERARRRALERLSGPPGGNPIDLETELDRRDRIDSTRAISPSIPAVDATVITTDGLTIDEVVQLALSRVAAVLQPNTH